MEDSNIADEGKYRAHEIKRLVYRVAKWVGFFRLARFLTRRGLRILAYHGFAMADEARFRPQLFMDIGVFRRRMEYLVAEGYPILGLQEALERLSRNNLPDRATVITFDDGFYSFYLLAAPVLSELRLPSSIYVTTYYCLKENPVFRLVVQYMFWKTTRQELDLDEIWLNESGPIRLTDTTSKDTAAWKIIHHAETAMEESQRVELCRKLGDRLGVDYDEIRSRRFLSFMNGEEVREAAMGGIDIQLHTHRHVLPESLDGVQREIEDNRRALEVLTKTTPRHFCYPSGIFRTAQSPALAAVGVASGVTCENGFNYSDTPPLTLSRFLDGNNISAIEFEAEMSGFAEVLRRLWS